jgi:hypothetical protein
VPAPIARISHLDFHIAHSAHASRSRASHSKHSRAGIRDRSLDRTAMYGTARYGGVQYATAGNVMIAFAFSRGNRQHGFAINQSMRRDEKLRRD